jgi:hypothetical protein
MRYGLKTTAILAFAKYKVQRQSCLDVMAKKYVVRKGLLNRLISKWKLNKAAVDFEREGNQM